MTVAGARARPLPRHASLVFLEAHGAGAVPHLQGTLLDHLVGTEEILRSWGCREELCRAGLCHATYGTDGFAPFLVPSDDRAVLAAVAGTDVEQIVYLYASCARSGFYERLSRPGAVSFRDRFLDRTFSPTDAELRDFVDLTLANELEIAVGPRAAVHGGPAVAPAWARELVAQIEQRASPEARRGARQLVGNAA